MKRAELIDFLKEILRVCGNSIAMEMVWLEKISSIVSTEGDDYQLVVQSSSRLSEAECVNQVIERFGMKMEKQGEFWIFSKR